MAMELSGKKIILLIGPKFEDSEALYPYYRMLEAGAQVTVAGPGPSEIQGKNGTTMQTDGKFEDFEADAWDAVIIPGGFGPDKVRMSDAALSIVRKANQKGCPVAAICHGPWVLASAEIINNRNVTSYKSIKDDLTHAGAHWQDAEVVVDGNLVTSRTPEDLPAFCREIIGLMAKVPASV